MNIVKYLFFLCYRINQNKGKFVTSEIRKLTTLLNNLYDGFNQPDLSIYRQLNLNL